MHRNDKQDELNRRYHQFLRLSLAAMSSTVVALIISLVFVSIRLQSTASDIAENAAPSVIALSDANRALERLRTVLGDRLDDSGDQVLVVAQLHHARDLLRECVSDYLALPRFPGEQQLGQKLRESLSNVEEISARIESLPPNPPNRLQLADRVRGTSDELSNQLDEAGRFNAEFLGTARRHIDMIRRIALPIAIAINVLGSGIAAGAVIMALRLVGRYAAAEAETRRQSELRANDLEAFSAQIAHDLLSPLTTTSLTLSYVRDKLPPDDQKTRNQLLRAETSIGYVRALVDGLFEFARSGIDSSIRATADVEHVLQDVRATFLPIAERDGIEFIIEPCDSHNVAASPGVVGSMIGNLVQNAFRAVAKRDIRRVVVRVSHDHNPHGDWIRIEVEDSGVGVDPDIEPLLFLPHGRNIRSPTSPGLGLGLATVKRLAERHQGSVGFRSERGVGSCFWFALPRVASSNSDECSEKS